MSSLPIEGLEEAMRPHRLFPIRTHERYGFYAGRAAGSLQLLVAVDGQAVLVVVFDGGGDFRESFWWDLAPGEEVEEALRERLGWEPALVRVKRFRVPPGPERQRDP